MTPVLGTGADVIIGSHACDLLLAAGHTVVSVDNFSTGQRSNLAQAFVRPGFCLMEADVCAPGALDRIAAEARPDAIIHLAVLVSMQESVQDPGLNFELNLRGTHLIAEAARLHGIACVVIASSAVIYGDAQTLPLT